MGRRKAEGGVVRIVLQEKVYKYFKKIKDKRRDEGRPDTFNNIIVEFIIFRLKYQKRTKKLKEEIKRLREELKEDVDER